MTTAVLLSVAVLGSCANCEYLESERDYYLSEIARVQGEIESKENQLDTIEGYQAILNRMMAVLMQTPEEDRDAEWQAQYDDLIHAMDTAADEWNEVNDEKVALEADKWWLEQTVQELEEEIANCGCS